MSTYIWTLWWQGEEQAPYVVKKCIKSMKEHANGATVVVLDCNTVNSFIEIPPHIKKKFDEGKITITHLSDIIRFQLLYHYGGLWIDSTVFVTEDIPDWIYKAEFYSIKNGTGGDYKNIAHERWTSFLLGGRANLQAFEKVNQLFSKYWDKYDSLVCYFQIDFCLNEVYNQSEQFRQYIEKLPDYKGNVMKLAQVIRAEDVIDSAYSEGIFHKLNWKMFVRKGKFDRVHSFVRHVRNLFDIKQIRQWGIKIVWYTFLQNVTRTNNGFWGQKIAKKYNAIMEKEIKNDIQGKFSLSQIFWI